MKSTTEVWLHDAHLNRRFEGTFETRDEAHAFLLAHLVPALERRWHDLSPMERREADNYFNSKGRVRKAVRASIDDLEGISRALWTPGEPDAVEWQILFE